MRLAVYALTIFASAFVLFAVQPMVGKALLPRLGGVPGVWTACLLFFQAALLAGYAYVWLGARLLSPRARVLTHLGLVALPLVLLVPFAWPEGPSLFSPVDAPALWALAFLALNVGAAFTILSATGPLLSHWFAAVSRARPYFLYAASNAGSFGALLTYPFVIEPWLDLPAQATVFRFAYAAVAVGIAAAGALVLRAAPPVERHRGIAVQRERVEPDASWDDAEPAAPVAPPPPSARRRAAWVGLAFVPTALLAGATTYLSLDLAPLPLLWVVPLAVYLLSFVLAFSDRLPPPPAWLARAACLVAVVLVFVLVTHANEPLWLLAALHILFLAAGSWIAHRRLADDAPHPAHLPEFYTWMALGGVLGTLVSGVLAPALLPDLFEYPAAIALACLTREVAGVVREDRPWKTDLPHVLIVAALVLGGARLVPQLGIDRAFVPLLAFGPAVLWTYRWMPLRRRYTLCLLAIVVAGAFTQDGGARRLTTRSFFGVLRVVDATEEGERHLLHGTTLHGSQRLAERDACVPLAYYVREGPLGWAFATHRARGGEGRTLGIGLGTGAAACFALPGEPWRFIEINPDVVRIAEDPRWFTYLRESPGRIEVSLGDGRIGLEDEADASLSMLIVDAFNSDSVPVHLLTTDAIRLYVSKLEPGGFALLHLSNRVLDLEKVLADVVQAEGVAARIADTSHGTWAAVARTEAALEALDGRWSRLPEGEPERAWTDAFSSLWGAIAR